VFACVRVFLGIPVVFLGSGASPASEEQLQRVELVAADRTDIDECSEKLACSCPHCSCKNNWGGFDCKCGGGLMYIRSEDTCIAKNMSAFGWLVTALVVSCLAGAGVAGYVFYKYRLRRYMDSEIMAIMAQYMPLDNQHNESQPLRTQETQQA